jgi:hypothetical protein
VQIRKKIRKYIPKFVFKENKVWKMRFKLFIQGQNRNIGGGGEESLGRREFSQQQLRDSWLNWC